MQLEVAPESYAALKATIRCLFDAQYPPSLFRKSSDAISWVRDLVKEFTALLAHIAQAESGERPADAADLELNAVTLSPRHARICYDIFLKGCEEDVRSQVKQCVDQLIHAIYKLGGVCHLRRNTALDGRVARQYSHLQQVDKGPRPYLTDCLSPPVYVDGKRLEDGELEEMLSGSDSDEEKGRVTYRHPRP
ncbi:hypothetical protein B0H63DRAFT_119226 [Podospora didyma]|uniref:Uncharacterized protein n=1 Tax=Podospora didyma TaxID=330526 RepID=A0AAE0NZI6_9PEZI|nr:hypothetical protein B0H63DRAFT_119226 [Podospora didyma]